MTHFWPRDFRNRSDRKYKDAPIGENLAKSGTTGVLDAKAEIASTMERWYKEGEAYNYDNPTYQVNTGGWNLAPPKLTLFKGFDIVESDHVFTWLCSSDWSRLFQEK